ncbi:MAG: HD domain-containing protein [Chloroflexi bacterium]|uniref:HD domain-containing protein n=1 Tax=Candidatus Chlorohelix allophototropha TaxID=3003348 RepID=A0A8T7M7R2_9CHLR|nr:HD domain-containing protein [Chloroflexota bacterium]WJW68097.1 HD domain-containing protein [Chloroflexota bacterium L227-S17]
MSQQDLNSGSHEAITQHSAHMDDYRALVKIACLLSSEPELDNLLNLIIDTSNSLLNADRSSLFLVDYATNELFSKIALGTSNEIRVKIGSGLAGTVAKTGEIINLRDAQNDPRQQKRIASEQAYIPHTMLTVPMRNHSGKIIGVIQTINKKTGSFNERDEEVSLAFASLAAVAIENATMRRDIELMLKSFIETMADTIDLKSPQTAGHSRRVAFYAAEIARELNLSKDNIELIRMAGLLHDYGKIGVPEVVLKKQGKLTEEEWGFMRQHVSITEGILKRLYLIGELKRLPSIAGQHHERVNGTGYPNGLLSEAIQMEAKILAVSDVYDALTVRRYYREPMTHIDALNYLRTLTGIEFEGDCVEALVRVVERVGAPQNPYEDTALQFGSTPAETLAPDLSRFLQ